MKVIILFTYGLSLSDWAKSGLLDRKLSFITSYMTIMVLTLHLLPLETKMILSSKIKFQNINIIPIYKFINKSRFKYMLNYLDLYFGVKLKKEIPVRNSIIKTNQQWGSWVGFIKDPY